MERTSQDQKRSKLNLKPFEDTLLTNNLNEFIKANINLDRDLLLKELKEYCDYLNICFSSNINKFNVLIEQHKFNKQGN
ncbi:MAG: hypothetical protein GY909_16100 [Oligoflexia bacterium]|nr:hypothetical protein [Oligoflexia bacterium]